MSLEEELVLNIVWQTGGASDPSTVVVAQFDESNKVDHMRVID